MKRDVDAEMTTRWAARGVAVDTLTFNTLTYRRWFLALRELRAEILAADLGHTTREVHCLRELPDTLSPTEVLEKIDAIRKLTPSTDVLHEMHAWLGKRAKLWAGLEASPPKSKS